MVLSRSARIISRSTTTEDGYNTDDSTKRKRQGKKKHWETRNNSSNVSAVLNSEMYNVENLRKPVVVSNHCYKTGKTPKFFCGDCYCRRSPVYPKLTMKQPTDEMFDELKKPKSKLANMYCQHACRCYGQNTQSARTLDSDSSPKNEKASNSSEASSPRDNAKKPVAQKPSPLKSTHGVKVKQSNHKASKQKDVQPIHKSVRDQELRHPQQPHEVVKSKNKANKHDTKINKHSSKKKKKSSRLKDSFNFSPTITTISEGSKTDPEEENVDVSSVDKCTGLSPNASADGSLKRLSEFRKEHYFDCHSTGSLLDEKALEHKCVHKFFLDDRLVPRPVHADVFGTSRCVECDKAIKSDVVRPDPNNGVTGKTNPVRKLPCCPDRQTRYKINISTNSDRIELKVPMSLDKYNQLFTTSFKIKKPASSNSLALRHQKGVA